MWAELATAVLFAAGVLFFLAGSIALLRFPDAQSRLHALTKADNLGLGFVALGAAVQAGNAATALKIMLIWIAVLTGSGLLSGLIARRLRRSTAEMHR